MTIKKQLLVLKENWILIVLGLILLLFIAAPGQVSYPAAFESLSVGSPSYGDDLDYARGIAASSDFAPEVSERKIATTASLSTEVERGGFSAAQQKLKAIITSSDSILLSENVGKSGPTRNQYSHGSYQIKVESSKYDAVAGQLKEIGEVTSFSENVQDVTGQSINNEIELEVEKARLNRYKDIFGDAQTIDEKLQVNDRLFYQEQRIKYLEDRVSNLDQRVEYSSISVRITEKRSDYANIVLVGISELLRDLVDSLNSLLHLLFIALPYGVAALIIWLVVKKVKKKKK